MTARPYTTAEVADYFEVSPNTVYGWIAAPGAPQPLSRGVNGAYQWRIGDWKHFLASRKAAKGQGWSHGTMYGYRIKGCRCEECRGANARYKAGQREKERAI